MQTPLHSIQTNADPPRIQPKRIQTVLTLHFFFCTALESHSKHIALKSAAKAVQGTVRIQKSCAVCGIEMSEWTEENAPKAIDTTSEISQRGTTHHEDVYNV